MVIYCVIIISLTRVTSSMAEHPTLKCVVVFYIPKLPEGNVTEAE